MFFGVLFLSISAQNPGSWSLPDLDIYMPLDTRQVVVLPHGESFILDYKGQRLLHHDAHGRFIAVIAKGGDGPGGLQGAKEIYRVKDRLYVEEWSEVQVFSLNGQFIETYSHDTYGETTRKVAKGRLIRREIYMEKTHSLLWLPDNTTEEEITIISWPAMPTVTKVSDRMFKVNPMPERLLIAMNEACTLVYVKAPGNLDILVFDVNKQKVIARFPINAPKVPFSSAYGDKLFVQLEKVYAKQGMKIQKDYPDFFPVVSNLFMTAEGNLLLRQNIGQSTTQKWLLDTNGKPATSPYLGLHQFIEAIYGDWAYVLTFDTEEETAGLIRRPLKEIESLLQAQRSSYDQWRLENY